MDLNGNVCAGQCGQTDAMWSSGAAACGFRKMCCRDEANASRMSSSDSSSSSRDPGHPKPGRQSGNYAEIREHERGGGNPCDGTALNFNDENVWGPDGCDPCCDSLVDESAALFELNRGNNVCANCKTGVTVSLSPQLAACEKKSEDPKQNVSFKRCYDSINQMWRKSRCKRSIPGQKKCTKDRKRKEPHDHRCTFENCCGNCDTFVMELSGSDCEQLQNCHNLDFDPSNVYFEDCCCSPEPKPCSSNVSVHSVRRAHRVCANCTEPVKCCSPKEPKCDLCVSSKHCLQRVHFTKSRNSCCSFCSRKCSPSKASMFVEIGNSVADVRCLRSGQVFHLCNHSSESLGHGLARRESDPVKRKKSDLLKRSKSKKRSDAYEKHCSPNCKTHPGVIGRSYSDKIECPEKDCDGIERARDKKKASRKSAQTVSNCSVHQMFSHKSSAVCFDTTKTDCWQQCETHERSMWDEIRRRKLWLQDSCKNFLKTAAASINQLVKQTSKGKLLKKSAKRSCGSGACERRRDRDSDPSNRLIENVRRTEKDCNAHCCQNACCSYNEGPNTAGVPQCQKYDHCNYEQQRRADFGIRERGGSDSSDTTRKRNTSISTRNMSSNSSSYRGSSSSRNPGNAQRSTPPDSDRGRGRQGQPVLTTIDSTIQTSVTHSVIEPSSITQKSIAYQRRVRQVAQLDKTAANGQAGRSPTKQQPARALASATPRTLKTPVPEDPAAPSPKSTTTDSQIQCEIITQTEVRCAPRGKEVPVRVADSCACSAGPEVTAEEAPEEHTFRDVSTKGSKGSDTVHDISDLPGTEPAEAEVITVPAEGVDETIDVVSQEDEEVQMDETIVDVTDESEIATVEVTDDTEEITMVDTEGTTTEKPGEATVELSDDSAELTAVEVPDDSAEAPAIEALVVSDDATLVPEADATEVSATDTVDVSDETTKVTLVDAVGIADGGPAVSKSKMAISKETKEGRSYASINMQTSSTILTKILSEFQIGNTRKRILMSIKLQTARDGDTNSFTTDSNGTEVIEIDDKTKHTQTRSAPAAKSAPKRAKRPITVKPTTSKPGRTKEIIDQSQCVKPNSIAKEDQNRRGRSEWSTRNANGTYGYCSGNCGKEKPLK
nr:uncharacterized protein LOC117218455 [Megalopta genalis]XP_033322732.1 uncharacterized protein LOC117218455 [Megalopta genalis]XP_033322733.1 uncharacterized protein LOC117218455 [Megalopta genalis]XP_033322734.1 uncharacterized protein LOC117218455 [Megalopta genalis]XP_033322736.1 uncharacterized protein LOC117218455 [Megalopta genalis]XP_033322737.1 uncharacterized protein LOC117218455 [Megalopta genalis]XP_033322738.1 uncharacterized protein LOC117218455 [Megalopta genalis]